MLELGFKVFLSYLAGSLNGALLVGKLYGGIDIRNTGSGNAGGTNALRTQGKTFAALVMIVDVAKGVVPALLLPSLSLPFVPLDPDISREWLTFACAGAAIFGHCFPVWFNFAGGKGAATTLGVFIAVAPAMVVPAALTWFGALLLFGYVGLATVLSAISIPLYIALTDLPGQLNLFIFTSFVALFMIYTHRSNLRKLLGGRASPDVGFRLLGRSD